MEMLLKHTEKKNGPYDKVMVEKLSLDFLFI